MEGADAAVENASPALLLHVFEAVAGQAGDDVDALLGEKCRRVFLAGLEEDREVAAVDDSAAECPGSADQFAKALVEFGGAAGDIEGVHLRVLFEQLNDPRDSCRVELLRSLRPGFDMAVMAGKIAF